MSFLSWFLRATLMLSFVLGTAAHAGEVASNRAVAMAAAHLQPHCADEQADHRAHHAAEAHAATGDMQHNPASGCCKVGNCHCAGSHCVSAVSGPIAAAHGTVRDPVAPFARSGYGSPVLPLFIRPPIA